VPLNERVGLNASTDTSNLVSILTTPDDDPSLDRRIYRLSGGKIVEQWGMPDVQGLMTQLKTSSVDK
jgi:hypothetical protein